ncbi:MAG: hypothetical protein ACTSUT_13560 [Promethearchaeota archaeon]
MGHITKRAIVGGNALNKIITEILDKAITRIKRYNRKTNQPMDI